VRASVAIATIGVALIAASTVRTTLPSYISADTPLELAPGAQSALRIVTTPGWGYAIEVVLPRSEASFRFVSSADLRCPPNLEFQWAAIPASGESIVGTSYGKELSRGYSADELTIEIGSISPQVAPTLTVYVGVRGVPSEPSLMGGRVHVIPDPRRDKSAAVGGLVRSLTLGVTGLLLTAGALVSNVRRKGQKPAGAA